MILNPARLLAAAVWGSMAALFLTIVAAAVAATVVTDATGRYFDVAVWLRIHLGGVLVLAIGLAGYKYLDLTVHALARAGRTRRAAARQSYLMERPAPAGPGKE